MTKVMSSNTGDGFPSGPNHKKRLLLVCSSGGHLLQLHTLHRALLGSYECVWVCFDKSDARSILSTERSYWAYFPTNRHLGNFVRNTVLAWKILRRERPKCVISTGAGIAVPFMLVARMLRIRTVYIESFARRIGLSLTGMLLYWLVDYFFVQSEKLVKKYPKAIFRGTVY